MANKWVLIIFIAIIGLALGLILKEEVCKVVNQELGTAKLVIKLTCTILSLPLDWIIFIVALLGLTIYLVRYYIK
ncbi:MAG: hypothetical protein AABW89_01200 [Nanoarchaeota archaeon]|mgnify:CR=1 FL=1